MSVCNNNNIDLYVAYKFEWVAMVKGSKTTNKICRICEFLLYFDSAVRCDFIEM